MFSQPQPTMLEIECDRETDGRWIAEVPTLPGVMVYGLTQEDAIAKVKALSLRVLADRLNPTLQDAVNWFVSNNYV
jgi:predicted RNase H-like HicB family nuclease